MKTIALIAASALASSAFASDDPADATKAADAAKSDISYVLAGGYAHFFATDFDSGGGDVAVDRGFGSLTISGAESQSYQWSMELSWEGSWYDFGGTSSLATAAGGTPWGPVQSVMLMPGATFVLDPRWRLTTRVLIGFAGENSADAWDSLTYGGIVAASYAFSETLVLGAGALAMSRIEDDPLIVPQLVIDWKPCKEFRVSNFAGPEAFPGGAGLEGIWMVADGFELALGSRYTYRRFRLDDSAANAVDGVGTDEGLPMWLRATLRGKCGGRLDLVAGMQLMGSMELADSSGDRLSEVDVESAPFVGLFFSWRY
ncbi:MAG: hypothetical protein RLZZ116_485 [Planctomycetota bacterium]|jgi:hypothetical protein